MKLSNTQPNQDQRKEQQQQQTGRSPDQQGGVGSTGAEANRKDNPDEKRGHRSTNTDRDGVDVQGRAGKSVVHPDDENGNDPDDETAKGKSR